MQNALHAAGGLFSNVIVQAVNSHDFLIGFDNAYRTQFVDEIIAQGQSDQPQAELGPPLMTVVNPTFITGFLPSVQLSAYSEPILVYNIPVAANPGTN